MHLCEHEPEHKLNKKPRVDDHLDGAPIPTLGSRPLVVCKIRNGFHGCGKYWHPRDPYRNHSKYPSARRFRIFQHLADDVMTRWFQRRSGDIRLPRASRLPRAGVNVEYDALVALHFLDRGFRKLKMNDLIMRTWTENK